MKYIDKYSRENVLYETMLSKLGSRFVIIPKPGKRVMSHGNLGFYYDKPVQTTMAVYHKGKVYALPFSTRYKPFEFLQQEIGLTYITYHCHSGELPFEVTYTISAPFYPQDIKLSVAPFFYITIRARNPFRKKVKGGFLIAMENVLGQGQCGEGESRKAKSELYNERDFVGFTFEDSGITGDQLLLTTTKEGITYAIGDFNNDLYADFALKGELGNSLDNRFLYSLPSGLCWDFELRPGEEEEKVFIYAGYHPAYALRVHEKKNMFLYTRYFKNIREVVHYAREEYKDINKKVNFFEDIFTKSSLPDETKKLIVFAFQSYIANTWWTFNDEDWFTVWEGNCRFHSTLDVAYNIELFSLFFWPELLKMQLGKWARYRIKEYLAHDIGDDLYICGQTYDHDMPVEESVNYVLLLYAYWRFTNDNEFVKGKYELVKELLDYLISTDKDGDGIPDVPEAVRNTVDAGSKTIEGSKGQTYLGVKCLSAYIAGKIFGRQYKDKRFEKRCNDWIRKIIVTLSEKSWLKDHFGICLDKNAPGRNGYSMYATNGLLYLLLTGIDIPLPDLFRQDIESHSRQLMREYGCTHSTFDNSTWISQNIWRDLVGLYLGLNTLGNTTRYWCFQLSQNVWAGGAFTDVHQYGLRHADLERYPRGLTSIGYLYALGGVSIDLIDGILNIAPPVISFRIPLTVCADWERQKVPYISLVESGQKVHFEITNFDSLTRFKKIHLRIPTLKKPEFVRILSDNSYSISQIVGKEMKFSKETIFLLKKISKDERRNLWIINLELSIKRKKHLKNLSIDFECSKEIPTDSLWHEVRVKKSKSTSHLF